MEYERRTSVSSNLRLNVGYWPGMNCNSSCASCDGLRVTTIASRVSWRTSSTSNGWNRAIVISAILYTLEIIKGFKTAFTLILRLAWGRTKVTNELGIGGIATRTRHDAHPITTHPNTLGPALGLLDWRCNAVFAQALAPPFTEPIGCPGRRESTLYA